MAWNRSSENGEAVSRPLQKRKGFRFPVRGAIAGAIVVLGAAVAAWWLWPDTSAPVAEDGDGTAGRRIREVTPAAAPKAEEAKPKDPPGYYNGKKISDDNRPPWMSPYHRIIDYGPIHTNTPSGAQIPFVDRVFEDGVDQQIGEMLLVEPGTMFHGPGAGSLYEDFDRNFLESLKVPIIVRQDDPEEVKAIKRAVIEVKADLKARMDAGENLQKIMEDNWREMRELGLYRNELDEQLDQICAEDDSITEQELDDYVAAANRMLAERGCAEMRTPSFLKEKVRMRAERRIREREANANQEEQEQ